LNTLGFSHHAILICFDETDKTDQPLGLAGSPLRIHSSGKLAQFNVAGGVYTEIRPQFGSVSFYEVGD